MTVAIDVSAGLPVSRHSGGLLSDERGYVPAPRRCLGADTEQNTAYQRERMADGEDRDVGNYIIWAIAEEADDADQKSASPYLQHCVSNGDGGWELVSSLPVGADIAGHVIAWATECAIHRSRKYDPPCRSHVPSRDEGDRAADCHGRARSGRDRWLARSAAR